MTPQTNIITAKHVLDSQETYKRTSQRMAEGIWMAYLRRHPKTLEDADLLFRLRIAHVLLLQFNRVFFHPGHSEPTEHSQYWLAAQPIKVCNPRNWADVG